MPVKFLLHRGLSLGGVLLLGVLMGCSGHSGSDNAAQDIVLVDLLPDTTRGLLRLSRPPGAAEPGWAAQFSAGGAAPGATTPWISCASTVARWTFRVMPTP
ncbi:MAG: hypothetical protein R3E50_06965 [Halioglobus sp.]